MRTVRVWWRRLAFILAAVMSLPLGASRASAAACQSTCRQELVACERACAGGGHAQRACRTACAERSTCTAPGARIRTLVYVVSKCTVGAFRQKLQIRHGDCDPVTVLDFPEPLAMPPPCPLIGSGRSGVASSPIVGAFHRMGVSPDGRHLVFEVTDDFTVLRDPRGSKPSLVPPGQEEGIFIVGTDGRGLRRLGPASRDPSFRFAADQASPIGVRAGAGTSLDFSPDGRKVVLTDLGPGPGGEEAVQIFTLDIVNGSRTQLTHLPVVADHPLGAVALNAGTGYPGFSPDGRIAFLSYGNLDGSNPDGSSVEWIMSRDGSGLERVPLPVAIRGSRVVPIFGVVGTGRGRRTDVLSVPGTPVNPQAGDVIQEIFFVDKGLLQLTKFGRADTGGAIGISGLTPGGQRAIFAASYDPRSGTNPSGTCQLFSIDTYGVGLRQLTHFFQPEYSADGCNAFVPPGCFIIPFDLDPATGTLVFYSSCDPFGTNPYGDQLFVMRPDGTRLRQLTHARGLVTEADGTVSAENIGPFVYHERRIR